MSHTCPKPALHLLTGTAPKPGRHDPVDVIDTWTGYRAQALRRAFRMTNEDLATRLGIGVRALYKWKPDAELSLEAQQLLDTLLYRAPPHVKARFSSLLDNTEPSDLVTAAEQRLTADHHTSASLEWLDQQTGWPPGTSRRKVAERAAILDPRILQDRGHQRGKICQQDIAAAIAGYYATGLDDTYGLYGARYGDNQRASTSVLTRPDWLDLGVPLSGSRNRLRLVAAPAPAALTDEATIRGAVSRLAEALATGMRIVNAPIYQLESVDLSNGNIAGTVSISPFVRYALTMDLLETELIDAIVAHRPTTPGTLPLRDSYLGDVASVLNPATRVCAGGALALCAIARPGSRHTSRPPDYLLLIQERSGRVLNSAHRLAVIPKAFHGPLVDYSADTAIGATLIREAEEELFGRPDVDTTEGNSRHADPMHPSRLSEPMRWLLHESDPTAWRMECTGFGFNLVSGNYEFASLIVIEDEDFWSRFGGHIEANWESDGLRRYSTLDRELLIELISSPNWSNEGLFALLQGLRRLSRLDTHRADSPKIEWETYRG